MKIAVFPARGGSKRIPKKNIRKFLGKPIIAWPIEAAIKSKIFDKIIVSTDDEAIAKIASSLGVDVPFIRPASLSDDHTGTTAVMKHAVDTLSKSYSNIEYVCCIYPTSPLLRSQDLVDSLQLLRSKNYRYVFSACSYTYPIQRALKLAQPSGVEMLSPENLKVRSQDLDECFHDAGQFYWGVTEAWQLDEPLFSTQSLPFILPRHVSQDIDTLEDWDFAEKLFILERGKSSYEKGN